MHYSVFELAREALNGHRGWKPAWRDAPPKAAYDIVIIGGGGHGLSTAYYLAKNHGLRNIAVVEKGWIGGGNAGRNTTIVRSNYLLHDNIGFYEHSLKLWENLEQTLNYNVMMSQRGCLNIVSSDASMAALMRRGNAMRLNNVDSEIVSREGVRRMAPFLDFEQERFPIVGGLLQKRGGTARHDAVVWGYARAASDLGVDIIQNAEVTGISRAADGRVVGVQTTRGDIGAGKIGIVVAGHSSRVAAMADVRLPIESHVLQAFVSEGLKPIIPNVLSFGAEHIYISQSDKGGLVIGGDLDGYNSYAQRGNLPVLEDLCEAAIAFMPLLGRARILRSWGGIQDMTMDGSPIMDRSPVEGLFLNVGWCYGGFKAIPASGWCFSHLLAQGELHPLASAFRLDRFATGHLLDERGRGAQPNLQ
jgi:heterotetrameric sarcosine oxidase beta subunit